MSTLTFRLGWPLYAGMAVAGAAAVVASASTLSTLAQLTGWQSWTPWLLPAALDIGGSAGGWCWLRPGVPEPARRFGRIVALAGATGTLLGNAAGHLMSTGYLSPGPFSSSSSVPSRPPSSSRWPTWPPSSPPPPRMPPAPMVPLLVMHGLKK